MQPGVTKHINYLCARPSPGKVSGLAPEVRSWMAADSVSARNRDYTNQCFALEIPNPKIQIPNKPKIPNYNFQEVYNLGFST